MVTSKSALTVSALAFAMMFGGGVYILSHLNTLAKPIAERIASDALGVAVSIGSMDISLQNKTVIVRDVHVANPPGYTKPDAMSVGAIDIALTNAGKDLIEFKDISVKDTHAYLEVTPDGINLQDLQSRIATAKRDPDTPESIKVIIEKIVTTEAVLHPSVTLIAQQDLEPITIPSLQLTGLGRKENGVLAQDAVAQIVGSLVQSFVESANDAGFYEGLSSDQLREMGIGQLRALGGKLNGEINKVTDGLKGLFE
ncbi:MAG: hypothetical protein ACPGRX_01725 [Bdellovibrionales bacterium]